MSPGQEAAVGARSRKAIELAMAAATLALGAMFVMDARAFSGDQAPLSLLLWLMPGAGWALSFVIIGTARLVALIVNGFWPLGAAVRWWLAAVALLAVWLPLLTAYVLKFDVNFGWPGLVLAALSLTVEGINLYNLSALQASRRRVQ